ncbi:MAG: fluoride efflux transporter CrcB [Bacteroidetes bacterium]|nr:fluoride efflux transporter CrcB [Bacteroidota bacterium]
MIRYILLGLGGAIGTVLRYLVSTNTYQFFQAAIFPWGTLVVNLTGSLIIGFLAGLNEANLIAPNLRTFLFIGLLGGYTTFSSFSLETLNLVRAGEIRYAIINVLVSNLLGIALAFGGLFISRIMMGSIK